MMHCRFIIQGGWERSIQVDDKLPHTWAVRDLPKMPDFQTFNVAKTMDEIVAHERVFRREQFELASGEREYAYLEIGADPMCVEAHECAALARARYRIEELERLCGRALDFMNDNGGAVCVAAIFMGGGRGEEFDDMENVRSELTAVVASVKDRKPKR